MRISLPTEPTGTSLQRLGEAAAQRNGASELVFEGQTYSGEMLAARARKVAGGLQEIGHDSGGFAFDNEGPRHKVWLDPFAIADRLVVLTQAA